MNKKIITFLSLVSLVIILSIYYIVSPFNVFKESNYYGNVVINNVEDLYFTTLVASLDSKYEEKLESLNSIIASSDKTNEEKMEAIKEKENIENERKLIKKCCEEIKKLGYESAFIEVNNKEIFTIVKTEKLEKGDVVNIINIIIGNFGNNYKIEVTMRK